ncbi:site-specific integrase [Brevibacillus choshinensis]|uniref:Site-specific integrase n=2 Tax=Brevibacillus choshinensis TaxID=54911 RepID=A0ABX7FYE2_BRECH|nr:site-specific integrase [Brevibacillus choshinensis]
MNYFYEYCPEGVKSKYSLLVFDHQDQPFLPLTDFYHDCKGRISDSSALSYLQTLLPFFTWLDQHSNYQGRRVQWRDPPEAMRVAIEDYLMDEMSCKVKEKDTFCFVRLTQKSPDTVNRFLSSVKSFYKSMIYLGQYTYHNPLIDSQAILNDYRSHSEGVRTNKPRMPLIGGTEDPIPTRRLTDSFFKLINEEWQPQIIDDPYLPYQVYQAGKKAKWSDREMVIARMLFETGARASEIIELTIGDYRARKSFQEVSTFNKGSHGRKVKFLRFSKDTVKHLMHYINSERKQIDPSHVGFDHLPDDAPVFLTNWGTPLTYEAWYYHWNKAMQRSELKINPHKARHWFVTTRMREVYNISKTEAEIQQRKDELIKYMKWKNADTIKVYEHYFDEEKHRQAHDQMLESMEKSEREYNTNRKAKRKQKLQLTLIKSSSELEFDQDLQELLDGLE